ncbi:MAG: twin-arginine translocation signal domain-containing protein [Tagaea sp.]|jgi:hypothetical protein|nr:twin-arginine translocation signal domain-containing protein [Azospirillum sp.]MCA3266422.1 twin-arginine translocation signal domain-containing protein [Azospirillum sp.]MCZ8123655.1 twin-arginine translocation signal domain-containing protein [Magnetospirillum sp.]
MTLSRRSFLAAAAAAPALAACADLPPPPQFPPISFAPRGTFRFEALRVEVAFDYQAPLAPPHVEHLFARTPEATLRLWAAERLAASGRGERFVRFVVLDARVTETDLPRTQGFRGTFTTEPAQRYDGRIECAVEIRQQRGNFRDGIATATAVRQRSVLENISLNDRERVWYEMTQEMMRDIDAELHRQIEASLARFYA